MNKIFFKENIKTLIYALIIAIFIRSILIQPFYIPSSSMEPNLLVGDRLFVTKYTYGYSKHSFPFSPPIYDKRVLAKEPMRGDLVVFKTPSDNRTDYIKRLIGLPGDIIQFVNGDIIPKTRPILEPLIFLTAKVIGNIEIDSTEIFVDNAQFFDFDEIAIGKDDPVYPRPGFTIVIPFTVPPAETDTENSAACGSASPSTIKASNVNVFCL